MAITEVLGRMAQAVAGKLSGKSPDEKKPATQDGNAPPSNLSENQKKYGPNFEKLKKQKPHIVAALQQLCLEYRLETMYADRYRIRRTKYARLFWQDIQYAGWNNQEQDYNFASGGVNANWGLDQDSDTGPRYEFVTNWYQGYGLSFIALVSSDVPSLSIYPKSREVQE